MAILFPVFVHSMLDLLAKGLPQEAGQFFKNFGGNYAGDHVETMNQIKALLSVGAAGESALQKFSENAHFVEMRQDKMPVSLSSYAFRLLFMWLLDGKHMLILGIVNSHINVKISSATPDMNGADFSFFESSGNEKPLIWKKFKNENGSATTTMIPTPQPLPPAVVSAQEADFREAAVHSSKALPSIAMMTFFHTQGSLNCVEMSADGALCAAGLGDSSLRVWDLRKEDAWETKQPGAGTSGKEYWGLVGHGGPVYGASFSPCSRFLLSSSEDSTVRLWGMETPSKGALVAYRGHNFPVWDVAFSPLGYYFATASHDHSARVFSTDHVFPLRILAGHLSDVNCVAWHPNSNYIATGSADKSIRLWEVNTGECVRIFTGHVDPIYSLAFSPDGSMLASAGDDGTVGIWDIGTSKGLAILHGHSKTVWSVAFNVNGNVLASGGADNKVVLWDVQAAANNQPVRARVGEHVLGSYSTKNTPVSHVSFTRKNLLFAAGSVNAK